MRRLLHGTLATALTLLLAPAAAHAASVAICHDLGPGSTAQAADKVDKFMGHMAEAAGLPEDTFTGAYHTDREACAAWVGESKPVLAVLDLATLLHYADAWKLRPIAHIGSPEEERYHVLVREGTFEGLDDLAGEEVWAALPTDDAFLSGVVLGGGGDPSKWRVQYTAQVLKGLRKVGRGQAAATVVDHEAYAHREALGLPHALVSIHDSEALPGLTMVAVGVNSPSGELVEAVRGALPKLCEGDGEEMCDQLGVDRCLPAEAATYEKLQKRYGE